MSGKSLLLFKNVRKRRRGHDRNTTKAKEVLVECNETTLIYFTFSTTRSLVCELQTKETYDVIPKMSMMLLNLLLSAVNAFSAAP